MFKHIVAALDGTAYAEAALPYVATIARAFGSNVTLLHVIDLDQYLALWRMSALGHFFMPDHETYVESLPAEVEAAAAAYLEDKAKDLRQQGLAVATAVMYGKAPDVLVGFATNANGPPDFIAMATNSRGVIGRALLGSVADRVLRSTHTPLLLVHPNGTTPDTGLHRLVVALDGSKLAEAILPYAQEVARRLAMPMHLVQALPELPHFYLGAQSESRSPGLINEIEAGADTYLCRVVAELKQAGLTAEKHVMQEQPDKAIVEFAQSVPGTLIALTTHGRSGPTRWALGSVADKVVRLSHGPVLVLRPLQVDPVEEHEQQSYQ
jgi:nucleotide-binding universal stress UspA family protein